MSVILNGTTGITTPGLINTGSETIVNLTTSGNTILGDASTDTLNVGNGGLVKDASGNVGIGTASPDANSKLTLNGASASQLMFRSGNSNRGFFYVDGTQVALGSFDNLPVYFQTNANTKMTLDTSGNLAVTGSISSNGALVSKVGTADGQVNLGSDNNTYVYSASTDLRLWTRNARPVTFYTNDAECGRFDASGNLLVGKTALDDSTNGFVYRTTGYISVARNGGAPCYFNRTGTDGAVVEIANDSSTVGSISVSGSSTSYNTSSDYRLKEDIAPMTGALATIQALKPVTYKWKIDGSDGQGFIAHELAEVVPDCVTGEKDATREEEYEISPAIPAVLDEEGVEVTPAVEAVMETRTVPVYQGIDTSFLVATLTAAIQEQQAMIDELKAKVAALEAA